MFCESLQEDFKVTHISTSSFHVCVLDLLVESVQECSCVAVIISCSTINVLHRNIVHSCVKPCCVRVPSYFDVDV
jgi:hypothetical protein